MIMLRKRESKPKQSSTNVEIKTYMQILTYDSNVIDVAKTERG